MKKEEKDIKNKIIIIGGSHHNMLGVVRGLGLKGLKSTVIITNDKPYSFVAKSKYIEKSYIVEAKKEVVLETLMTAIRDLDEKAIIVPTSDFAAELIDENYNNLVKYCVLPSINKKQGEVVRYMDKYEQYKLAHKHGIKMARSAVMDLSRNKEECLFEAKKYILKPIISANGEKSDIRICAKDKIGDCLDEFERKGYKNVLLQEYLEFDTECGLIGCADGKKIILPGIIKKIRIYPLKRGSNSFARIEKIQNNPQIERIKSLLLELDYSGMFDIEIFIKDKEIYLNEINFRNSGNTFAYCYSGVFIIYLWILLSLGYSTSSEKESIDDSFMYIDEKLEIQQLFHKNINLREFFEARKNAKARLLHYYKDLRPSLYKVIYAIKRRVSR